MADKNLFKTASLMRAYGGVAVLEVPETDTVNEAGGTAYSLSNEAALAQYAVTGCLTNTFYATAETQLAEVLKLANAVSPLFLAQTAIYARESGYMKDMPALLLAILATRPEKALAGPALERAFPRVINNGKVLGNFVRIIRSGVVGRRSLGTQPKRLVRAFLARNPSFLFGTAVGMEPSIVDIIKMVHPKPATAAHKALFGYWLDKEYNSEALPQEVLEYVFAKAGYPFYSHLPKVDFRLLTALELTEEDWKQIAHNATWTQTRMNLNTFLRHKVFESDELRSLIAARLRDPEAIEKARAFPYQLLMAYEAARDAMPTQITDALQDALDTSLSTIPEVDGKVFIFPDVSGSMDSPVTGNRGRGATSDVSCRKVAAMIAAAFSHRNVDVEVIPFSDNVIPINFNRRDSVATIAKAIANLPSGGTNVSAPLRHLNERHALGDLLVYVSDNESWIDSSPYSNSYASFYRNFERSGTATMREWAAFKSRNSDAKMVCVDLTPNAHTQATESPDILNVGGFSDSVFDIVSLFAKGELTPEHFVGQIRKVVV